MSTSPRTGTSPSTGPGTAVPVRRATTADIPALVRLRASMLEAMGVDTGGPDAPWREAAARWFARRLPGDRVAAFVADDPGPGVVACAVGTCDAHLPGPADAGGLHGHLSNVSTDARFRRLGHARRCVEALLRWFEEETPVTAVDLNATEEGAGLYTSPGFAPPRYPTLQGRGTRPGRPGP
ncbi:GNAT family N-acetyltransferase [uncultured Streptomyces sp.]|uniref:GNAT family N-acetyltransferase n=1 Tax=uncultured Streptomyces sp. TaxID=174707 RepID=UPI00262C745A|nr:GNAT family N-acetyltransferase [uncultured Streptomyces sp.]